MRWTLDDVAARVREAMAPAASLEEARANYERLTEVVSEPPAAITFDEETVAGTPGVWVSPPAPTPGVVVVHCHGGGFVSGSANTHRNLCAHLSLAVGAAVFVVDYDRAPEAVFPRQRDQVCAVVSEMAVGNAVVLGGDSAGGGLVFQVACALRDGSRALPAVMYAVGPMADFEMTGDSYSAIGTDPWSTSPEAHRWLVDAYLGSRPASDARVNVLYADLTGLPPTLIQVASDEFLRDDAVKVADRLQQAGVEVRLDSVEGVTHDWHLFAPHFAPAIDAIGEIGAFVRDHLPHGRTPT